MPQIVGSNELLMVCRWDATPALVYSERLCRARQESRADGFLRAIGYQSAGCQNMVGR